MSDLPVNPFDLTGKVSLVTGSAAGIGSGMALGLARAGSDLMLVDIQEEKLAETASHLSQSTGRRVLYTVYDLENVSDLSSLVSRCVQEFGRLDILVNNAAVTVRKPFMEITPEEFDRVLRINSRAPYFLSQEAARQMISQGEGGKIINMASLTSKIGVQGVSVYGVSKGGVYSLTKGLAVELARHGICVNAIAPGFFVTDLTSPVWEDPEYRERVMSRIPMGRTGTPADAAGTVVYLASSASDYLTGRVLFLDGGWMAS